MERYAHLAEFLTRWAWTQPSRYSARLNGFLELLGGSEGDLLGGFDLDRLARLRVATRTGGALAHLQNTKAAQANLVALLQALRNDLDHLGQHLVRLTLRQLMRL